MIHNNYESSSHSPIPIHSLLSTSKTMVWISESCFLLRDISACHDGPNGPRRRVHQPNHLLHLRVRGLRFAAEPQDSISGHILGGEFWKGWFLVDVPFKPMIFRIFWIWVIWIFSYAKLSSHTSWNQVLWWWLCQNGMIERWWFMVTVWILLCVVCKCIHTKSILHYTAKTKYIMCTRNCAFQKLSRHVETVQMNVLSFLFRTCLENAAIKCQGLPGYGWGNSTSKETRVASLVMSFLLKSTYPYFRDTSMSFIFVNQNDSAFTWRLSIIHNNF